ncbi:hypothetical protein LguiA_014527 [Lonicera macranthoides]
MTEEKISGEFTQLIPGLPEELALECLTRLHYTAHRLGSQVCSRWRHLIRSREFYYHRQKTGHTHKVACLIQSISQSEPACPNPAQSEPTGTSPAQPEPTGASPVQSEHGEINPVPTELAGPKPAAHPSYGVTVFDPVSGTWDRVDPVPKYPNGLPLFCQVASTEGKLVVMGGWDPVSWDPIKDVNVYEFATRRWTRRKDMPASRSFFAAGACGTRVYIAGGHDESKNALNSAWAYDLELDEWIELTRMSEERDECEGLFVGSEFWVISGYGTESQGNFTASADSFNIDSGEWTQIEDAWRASQSPRSTVGLGRNGNLICWAELDPAVRIGACGVDLGGRSLVTGSAYQGAPQGFFTVERKEGEIGKFVSMDVPGEFTGFVQSSCCVEV